MIINLIRFIKRKYIEKEREKLIKSLYVAIQWIDEGQPDRARDVLAKVYVPILQEEDSAHIKRGRVLDLYKYIGEVVAKRRVVAEVRKYRKITQPSSLENPSDIKG